MIDDRFLRVGSANLNNRSAGFDTECDVAIEATTPAQRDAVARFRARDLGHFLGHAPSDIEAVTAERGLIAAIDMARKPTMNRLAPLHARPMDPVSGFIADHHLGDPVEPTDAWRPFFRRERVKRRVGRLHRRLVGDAPPPLVDTKIDD